MTGPAAAIRDGARDAGRPARGASGASPTGCRWPAAGSTSRSCQSLNPEPPGSMVVVSLLPTVRYMDRCGMATGTRVAAQALWGDALPADRSAGRPGPRAVRGRERRPRRTVRLAGHVRPDLPGHQPARLRRLGGGRLVPGPRRVHPRPGGRGLAGAGHPPRPGRRSARRATAPWGSSAWTRPGSPASAPAGGPATTPSWRWTSTRSASRSTSARSPGTPSCPRSSSIPPSRSTSRASGRRTPPSTPGRCSPGAAAATSSWPPRSRRRAPSRISVRA